MHVDLFSAGHSVDEVYRALGEHQMRDLWVVRILDGLTVLTLLGALANFNGWATPLWVLALLAGTSALRHYIDMSNRNFFMHRLDWERATERS